MSFKLPMNFTPEGNRNICKAIFSGANSIDELKNSNFVEKSSTARYNLDYARKLGFIEKSKNGFKVTDKGKELALLDLDKSGWENLYLSALKEYSPYTQLVAYIVENQEFRDSNGELALPKSRLKDWFKQASNSDSEDRIEREINTALRTFAQSGLGQLKIGRRGSETRLVLDRRSKSKMKDMADDLSNEVNTGSKADDVSKDSKEDYDTKIETNNLDSTSQINITINLTPEWSKEEVIELINEVNKN